MRSSLRTSRRILVITGALALAGFVTFPWFTRLARPADAGTEPDGVHGDSTRDAARSRTSAAGQTAVDGPGREPMSGPDSAGLEAFRQRAEAAMAIQDPALRQTMLAEIVTAWLNRDPHDFVKYFMALEVAHDLDKLGLLADALQTALPRLEDRVASSDAVKDLLRRFILHLARVDPDRALAWTRAWLLGDSRDHALLQISRSLAKREVGEGLRVTGEIESPLRRTQSRAAVGAVWAGTDPEAALEWAASLGAPAERASVLNSIYLVIAQTDPGLAALRLARTERDMTGDYRAEYLGALAAMNLTEADLANDRANYEEMLRAGALPPPTSPDIELMAEAARVIATRLAAEDASLGTEWAQALENEFLRLNGVKGALAGMSRNAPAEAVAFFVSGYPQYPEMLNAVYETWARSDPAAAASGTNLVRDPALRAAATEAVARVWAENDPEAAARWTDRIGAADRSDAAQLAVASALSASNPREAWTRSLEIGDPSLRYRGLKAAFAVLVTTDPSAARDVLAAARLPEKHAERLAAMLAAVEAP